MGMTHLNQKSNEWIDRRINRVLRLFAGLFFMTLLAVGCAHYPVNQPLKQVHSGSGYRARALDLTGKSEKMILILTFSGGGTRAAAVFHLPPTLAACHEPPVGTKEGVS